MREEKSTRKPSRLGRAVGLYASRSGRGFQHEEWEVGDGNEGQIDCLLRGHQAVQ